MSGSERVSKIDMTEAEPLVTTKRRASARVCSRNVYVLLVVVGGAMVIALAVGLGVGLGTRNESSFYDSIKSKNLMTHLQGLQDIAANSSNNSRSVANGYNASAEFVFDKLEGAGYDPERQFFTVPLFTDEGNANFSAFANISGTDLTFDFLLGPQFAVMRYSGSGQIANATLAPITGGCNDSDYEGLSPGDVALVSFTSTDCPYFMKANLSQAHNASAVIMRRLASSANLGPPTSRVYEQTADGFETVQIPVLGVTYQTGEQLLDLHTKAVTLQITIETATTVTMHTTYNILAYTKTGRDDSIVVVGTHLDSVPAGPGINDNGSGSAANLEMALQVASQNREPENKVLFAFWGAEELGLLGSYHFVRSLTAEQKQNISLNLNYDMIGSPNFVRMVYNGSMASEGIVNGSVKIQQLYEERFRSQNLAYRLTPFTGRSDYGPFIEEDIPAGGLFTGAEEIKTEQERIEYGGFANAQLDPCYHRDCDTLSNINEEAYEEMAQAAAYALDNLMMQKNLKEYLRS